MKINWQEASTKRGLIWFITAVIGLPMAYFGKDVSQLILLASGIAGGLGVVLKD